MPSIAFSARYFEKIRKDYSNWKWAVAREFAQNAIDAGAKTITVTTSSSFLTVENDAAPMSKDVLVGKLLTMGETTKTGSGSTGGMGVAKGILYLCHPSYQIHTGSLKVVGSGGSYDLDENAAHYAGTKNVLELNDSDEASTVARAMRVFATYSQWRGKIIINGHEAEMRTKKGYHRRNFAWGDVYTNNSHEGLVIVRKDGQPMFHYEHDYKKCVIVELSGDSTEILTANRDGLQWPYSNHLQNFLCELAVNKRSALKNRDNETRIDIYPGEVISVTKKAEKIELYAATASVEAAHIGEEIPEGEMATAEERTEAREVKQEVAAEARAAVAARASSGEVAARTTVEEEADTSYEFNLFVKNSTGMKVPKCYLPGEMSEYARKLLRYYVKAVKVALAQAGKSCKFSVGLLFDNEDTVAEYAGEQGHHGHVFYIAPTATIAKGGTRAFKKRYKLDATGRWNIVSAAIHEVVHIDCEPHDESFANLLSDRTAIALLRRSEFC